MAWFIGFIMRPGFILMASIVAFSQSPPSSDPQALALAAQAITAMTGGTSISDVSMSATVTRVGDNASGTATMWAKGTGESRIDFALSTESLSEIRNDTGYPQGASVVNGGAQQAWAMHNCWINASWFFPPLSILAANSDPTVVLKYIGQELRNGASVQHLRAFRYETTGTTAAVALIQTVSTTDIYLDSISFLPTATTFNFHPDTDAMSNIPMEVDFVSYQSFSGVQLPSHVEKLVDQNVMLDIVVTSASFNSGLPDSLFAITTGQ